AAASPPPCMACVAEGEAARIAKGLPAQAKVASRPLATSHTRGESRVRLIMCTTGLESSTGDLVGRLDFRFLFAYRFVVVSPSIPDAADGDRESPTCSPSPSVSARSSTTST